MDAALAGVTAQRRDEGETESHAEAGRSGAKEHVWVLTRWMKRKRVEA
jgi:hypothetical protein